MKMIFIGLASVWFLSFVPFSPPAHQDLIKAMTQFDQGYIPIWYYVHSGDMIRAKKAVFYLEFQWQRFQTAWNSQTIASPESGLALQRVSVRLSEAYLAIDHNDPANAKRSLERAQKELRQLRETHGLSYFLDPWYSLEGDLSDVLATLNDRQLKLMEWEEVEEMALGCSNSWNAINKSPTDCSLLGWDEAEHSALVKTKKTITQKMASLQKALHSGGQDEAAKAAQAAYEAFLSGLKLFGNFSVTSPGYAARDTNASPAKIRAL